MHKYNTDYIEELKQGFILEDAPILNSDNYD